MKSSKLIEIFKDGNIVIPIYFLKNYQKFDINSDEFLLLMYLYNCGNNFTFDPDKFSNDLGYDLATIMSYINNLTDKSLVRVDVKKNDKGFMEDIVVLDGFYDKLKMTVVSEVSESDK